MGENEEGRRYLTVPEAKPTTYARNYIKTAVCELRFPSLIELDRKLVQTFHGPLRKEYPNADRQKSVGISPGSDEVEHELAYLFRSRDASWTVAFKPFSFAVETQKYKTFEDMVARLQAAINASTPVIDADFFTRVGLRYTNVIPIDDGELRDWINPELVGPLENGTFGTLTKYIQEVRGYHTGGQYTFRHGFAENSNNPPEYVIDVDFYSEDVESSEVIDVVTKMHRLSFSFFMWALGPKAIDRLGMAKAKSESKDKS